MKTVPSRLAFVCALAVAACDAQGLTHGLNGVAPQAAVNAATRSQIYLYVANSPQKGPGSVSEYALENGAVNQRVNIKVGISKPLGIKLDAAGNLYVANANFATRTGGWVDVYTAGTTTAQRRISSPSTRFPSALAFDKTGDLYVANEPYAAGGGSVDVYPPESATESLSITEGITWPTALGVNHDGSLYVGNSNLINAASSSVSEYARGAATPELTIESGTPKAVEFDPSDNLYLVASEPSQWQLSVAVFAPNSSKQLRSIPAAGPSAVAFDRHGNLYVANDNGTGSIAVYASQSRKLLRTITTGISKPSALAFDNAWNLYVANLGNNSVTVYAPGKSTVLEKITHGINVPIALAVGAR